MLSFVLTFDFFKKLISFKTSVWDAEHFRVVIKRLFQAQIENNRNEVPFWKKKKRKNIVNGSVTSN